MLPDQEVGVYSHNLEHWLPVQVLESWNLARSSKNKVEVHRIRPDGCPDVQPTDPDW